MIKKLKKNIKCCNCKKIVGFLKNDDEVDVDVRCPECNGSTKKKKKKSKTVKTAASNYAKTKGGVRKDIHETYYFRSATEANVARLFNHLGISWKFEERSFSFTGYKTKPFVYIMDFEITKIDKRKNIPEGFELGFVEVKGWMNPSSRQKLRRLRKQFPEDADKTTVIIYDKYRKKDVLFCKKYKYKYMFYDALTAEYRDVVPNWE